MIICSFFSWQEAAFGLDLTLWQTLTRSWHSAIDDDDEEDYSDSSDDDIEEAQDALSIPLEDEEEEEMFGAPQWEEMTTIWR